MDSMDNNIDLQKCYNLQSRGGYLKSRIEALADEIDELDRQAGELITVIDRVDALINKMAEENSGRRTALGSAVSALSVLGLLRSSSSFMSVFSDNMSSFVRGAEYNNMSGGLQTARSTLLSELERIVNNGQSKISNYEALCGELTQINEQINELGRSFDALPVVGMLSSVSYALRKASWRNLTTHGPNLINLRSTIAAWAERVAERSMPRM